MAAIELRFLIFIFYLCLPFLTTSVLHDETGYSPIFKDFTIAILQKHIQISRHLPVCILYRITGEGSSLEAELSEIWSNRTHTSFAQWQIGGFPIDQTINPPKQLQLPQIAPHLRCYLGLGEPLDYDGKPTKRKLAKWLTKLSNHHADQLQEASVELAEKESSKHNQLLLLGFSGLQKHHEVEEMLVKASQMWSKVRVLFAHPNSPQTRLLMHKYNVTGNPSLVFIENSRIHDYKPTVIRTLKAYEVTWLSLRLYLTIYHLSAKQLTPVNFESIALQKSKYYTPMLTLFYSWWSPGVHDYFTALQRTMDEFVDLNIFMRFATMEITPQAQQMFVKWLPSGIHSRLPYSIVFWAKWEKTTVVGIEQVLIVDRPTPGAVTAALAAAGVPLLTKAGEEITYKPWGSMDSTQISHPNEGPYGTICLPHSSNITDNTPVSRPVLEWVRRKRIVYIKPVIIPETQIPWHLKFDTNSIESRLSRVGSLPVVTSATWQEVVEKSHAPSHAFMGGQQWQGEITKVMLIIFLIADCSSCRRNMDVFDDLQLAVSHVEGGRVYLMNCSADPVVCQQQGVSGYPTLRAYRGRGWQHAEGCLSTQRQVSAQPVYMEYHGVLRVPAIMNWFSESASPAIINVGFGDPEPEDDVDVYVVATVIPRGSRYLPRVMRGQGSPYPYTCLRAACEELYSQAPCYMAHSHNIPAAEYSDTGREMVITQVDLVRADGLEATMVKLGRSLINTLEDEANSELHKFHRPHRYGLRPRVRCEDDHALCTELIVEFTRDHGRLPLTHMTDARFHTKNSLLFDEGLPVLIALVHQANITDDSKFHKTLQAVAKHFYNDLVTVTVDVDRYTAWSQLFVPQGYSATQPELVETPSAPLTLQVYPRLCVVRWADHHRAAFYPPVTPHPQSFAHFRRKDIISFLDELLADLDAGMIPTEHF